MPLENLEKKNKETITQSSGVVFEVKNTCCNKVYRVLERIKILGWCDVEF